MSHAELHKIHRVGWLRAAVLGANDGIVSNSSLIIGIAAAGSEQTEIILAGTAGLVAGAISMAAGEYVSVCSQRDTELADLALEQKSLDEDGDYELAELTTIYQDRGLEEKLASKVAEQLMQHDALGAHARDELGITENGSAKPIVAASSSACSFTIGATLPLLITLLIAGPYLLPIVAISSLVFLAGLGAIAAIAGGAPVWAGALRVTFWGTLAMALTALVGKLFGMTVG